MKKKKCEDESLPEQVGEVVRITQQEAECMIRFVDALRIQFYEGREADFCEPCCGCSHVHECKPDTWYENTRKLSRIAGVSINLALPTRRHK